MDKVFLDTTIQFDRVLGSAARKTAIADRLRGKHVLTSTYVHMEYNRTVVADAIYTYNLIQAEAQPGDALARLAEGPIGFRRRALGRSLRIWGLLHNLIADEPFAKQKALDILILYIRDVLPGRFMNSVDELLNTTDCDLSKDHPRLVGDAFQLQVTCRRVEARCQLPTLIKAHRADIERVSERLRAHPDGELRRIAQVAVQVLQAPGKAQGQKNCWRLGDLIIALEAPPNTAIYTTNVRHFAPLCEILGKRLLEEEAAP